VGVVSLEQPVSLRYTVLNFVMTMWCILLALRKDRKRAKKPGTINKVIKVPPNKLHPAFVLRPGCVFERKKNGRKSKRCN